ncbi:MAG: thioredoxin domain-containing protein, partial [Propionibacteriaceae bacterium]|nr:thioredoxin domain-containing protein [Propionibacteriaceae bacterium]
MRDLNDAAQAWQALADPATTTTDLAKIANHFVSLRTQVALHPNADPGLLSWLDSLGDPGISAVVSARRARDAAAAPWLQQVAGPGYPSGVNGAPAVTSSKPRSRLFVPVAIIAGLLLVFALAGTFSMFDVFGGKSDVELLPGDASPSVILPSAEVGQSQAPAQDNPYFVGYGNPQAKAQVDIYYDFMCPYCSLMERANGAELRKLADDGVAFLKFHPMNFLDAASLGKQ